MEAQAGANLRLDVKAINDRVRSEAAFVELLFSEIGKVIVGQRAMVERVLIGLFCDGHVLLEGVPGLAKTLTVSTLARTLQVSFKRIQFTPDLLPADLIGTLIYRQNTGEFAVKKGPVFANIILADEVNRAPAKVQSALLEAMQERQVTIGETTYELPRPFLVMATQNPVEQEGTYPLPEAQVDRFLLKVKVGYPTREEELEIMARQTAQAQAEVATVCGPDDILRVRSLVREVYVDPKLLDYIVDLVLATREPARCGLGDLARYIEYGASPRATIALNLAARAHAFIRQRGFVTPEDIKAVGLDVLRHRVILTYEAEADEETPESILRRIFDAVEVP
jgi:MoxR-like ATPase